MSEPTSAAQIAAWLAEATPEAATKLRDYAESTEDKEARKAARRALYLLSQKHILPAPHAPIATIALPPTPLVSLRAWGSTIDGAGNRMLFLTWPNADGGNPNLMQLLCSDEAGVKDFGLRRVSRRELEEIISRFSGQLENGMGITELDPDYARLLIEEARELNRRNRTQTPPGFLELLPRIGSPQQDHVPPIYALVSPDDVRAEVTIPQAPEDLFALPWFEPWFLDAEEMAFYLDLIPERVTIYSEDAERRAAYNELHHEAIMDLMTRARRLLFARRLEETAYVLWQGGKQAEARQAVFHALELRDSKSADEVLFAGALIFRTMLVALQMAQSGETTDSIRAEQGL